MDLPLVFASFVSTCSRPQLEQLAASWYVPLADDVADDAARQILLEADRESRGDLWRSTAIRLRSEANPPPSMGSHFHAEPAPAYEWLEETTQYLPSDLAEMTFLNREERATLFRGYPALPDALKITDICYSPACKALVTPEPIAKSRRDQELRRLADIRRLLAGFLNETLRMEEPDEVALRCVRDALSLLHSQAAGLYHEARAELNQQAGLSLVLGQDTRTTSLLRPCEQKDAAEALQLQSIFLSSRGASSRGRSRGGRRNLRGSRGGRGRGSFSTAGTRSRPFSGGPSGGRANHQYSQRSRGRGRGADPVHRDNNHSASAEDQ